MFIIILEVVKHSITCILKQIIRRAKIRFYHCMRKFTDFIIWGYYNGVFSEESIKI